MLALPSRCRGGGRATVGAAAPGPASHPPRPALAVTRRRVTPTPAPQQQPSVRRPGPTPLAALPIAGPALADLGAGLVKIPGILGDTPFTEGVVSGFLLIFFSELGDKTFFIALLLATKRSRALVFIGTFSALAAMTVISVGLGRTLHALDDLVPALPGPGGAPLPLDDLLAVALLVVFGVKTLAGAADAEETAAGEEEEAAEAVGALSGGGWGPDAATAALLASTFALVFAAEWGDKSFLATIALAAASSPGGVVLGAVAGHGAATALAVTGGALLQGRLSERTVSYVGGSLFLVFAASTIVDIFRGV